MILDNYLKDCKYHQKHQIKSFANYLFDIKKFTYVSDHVYNQDF